MGVSKIAVSLSQIYSRILTETFVYLVSWHGQLMSAYTVCPPLLVGQTMTIKYRHQLTMPSNIVNKISCLDSAIIMYLILILVVQLLFYVVVTIFSIAVSNIVF